MKLLGPMLLLVLLSLSSTAFAKMRAMLTTDTSIVIAALKAKGKKISVEEKYTLKLAQFALTSLGMTQIHHYDAREPEKMDVHFMKSDIESAVISREWDKPVTAEHKAFITGHSAELKSLFGEESFFGAWIHAQVGNTDLAKVILLKRFNLEYESVMKMTHIFRHSSQPLQEVEAIAKAVKSTATSPQKMDIENKMREMKSHLSSLPDSGIVT